MKDFTVKVPIEAYAYYHVQAESAQEAIAKAQQCGWKYNDSENENIKWTQAEITDPWFGETEAT